MDTFVIKKKPKEKEDEEGETKSSVSSKKRPAEEESQGLDLEILESTSTLSKTSASATASSSSSKSKKKKPSEADEKKEKRTFKPMWTVGRPWLTFDGKAMFCSICKSQALKSQKGRNALAMRHDVIIFSESKLGRSQWRHVRVDPLFLKLVL